MNKMFNTIGNLATAYLVGSVLSDLIKEDERRRQQLREQRESRLQGIDGTNGALSKGGRYGKYRRN